MTGKYKAFLWVLAIFLIGTAFGAVSTLFLARPGPAARVPQQAERSQANRPQHDRSQLLQRMVDQLGLDTEQTEKVRVILEESREGQEQIEQANREEMKQHRAETVKRIREILRPDQQQKMQEFLQKLRANRANRNRRSSGN